MPPDPVQCALQHLKYGTLTSFIAYITNCNISINTYTDEGKSFIMYAAEHGKLEILKYLHNNGVPITALDPFGRNAMIFAAAKGYLNIVTYLHEQGISGDSYTVEITEDNASSSEIESDAESEEFVAHSLEEDVQTASSFLTMIPVLYASAAGHLSIVRYLVETCRVDLNTVNHDEKTAATAAVEKGHLHVLQYLLTHGTTTSLEDLLIIAQENNHSNIVEYLSADDGADTTRLPLELESAAVGHPFNLGLLLDSVDTELSGRESDSESDIEMMVM